MPTTALVQDDTTTDAVCATDDVDPALLEQDLLVEDVCIDGMCGVY